MNSAQGRSILWYQAGSCGGGTSILVMRGRATAPSRDWRGRYGDKEKDVA